MPKFSTQLGNNNVVRVCKSHFIEIVEPVTMGSSQMKTNEASSSSLAHFSSMLILILRETETFTTVVAIALQTRQCVFCTCSLMLHMIESFPLTCFLSNLPLSSSGLPSFFLFNLSVPQRL